MATNPLKQLTRRSVGIKAALDAMSATSDTEDDRSAAISAGALVELALEKAIKHRLRRMSKADQSALFDGTAPLATFSAKCRMGFALGIYGKEVRHDLEAINAIRNVFAHSVTRITFRNRRISNKVFGMHTVKNNTGNARASLNETRYQFLAATRTFWLELVALAGPRIPLPPAFPAYQPRTLKRRAHSKVK